MILPLRRLSLWLAGHTPSALMDESREATHSISLTGGMVGVAACVTAANWAVAGFSLAGSSGPQAWLGATAGAICAVIFVLSIDRAGAFSLDAQAPGRIKKLMLLGTRVGACLLVSSVTAEFLTPLLIGHDADRMALEQREQRDATRAKQFHNRYDIDRLSVAVGQAKKIKADAQAALDVVPDNVQELMAQANACKRRLANRRSAKPATAAALKLLRQQIAALAKRCTGLESSAQAELADYRAAAQNTLSTAVTAQGAAEKELSNAQAVIKNRLTEAEMIEKAAITPQSTFVTDSVLNASPTARRKWLDVYLLLVLLELSPLGFKWVSGPSASGTRMAVDHELAVARHLRRRDDAIHADEERLAVRDCVDEMLHAVLQSPKVRDDMKTMFESKIVPLLSFDLTRRVIAEMEELHELRRDSVRRCPDVADTINALSDAMLEELLTRTRGVHSTAQPVSKAA